MITHQPVAPLALDRKLDKARGCLLSRDLAQALPRYEKLSRAYPCKAAVWFEYGNAAAGSRDWPLAERAWRTAAELEPENARLLLQIGHQCQAFRRPDAARSWFARAASADPRGVDPRISLAVLAEQRHCLGDARELLEECLAMDPLDEQARYLSAVLDRRETKLEMAERRLRDLIASSPQHPYVRYACRYELAQVLDRTERYDEAMALLAEAKRLVASLTDVQALLRSYDQEASAACQVAQSLPRNALRSWAQRCRVNQNEPLPALAFLGGHPRSGTTLLEQVMDAHPAVAALDEPTAFRDVLQLGSGGLSEPATAVLNVLRRRYINAVMDEAGSAAYGKLLIDKNPSLTARLPALLRVCPDMRVLIALRDPRDVAISCYFQNILLNTTNANFLSFERIAKHYADLMEVWLAVREWEGLAWMETRYEDLVAKLEPEGRRVTEFLSLSWDEAQERFYEKSRSKQLYSPTYEAVTRPAYTHAVGRWRSYEKHLGPILRALRPYCEKFGYQ